MHIVVELLVCFSTLDRDCSGFGHPFLELKSKLSINYNVSLDS